METHSDPEPSSRNSVYAVVVTFNGEKWIEKCLRSLKENKASVTTIVVDNCSADKTTDIITRLFPEVQLISNTQNAGFGKANNQGISLALQAGATHVFLLNQDAWVQPATIGLLLEASEKNPDYGIISPMHLTGSGDTLDRNFEFYLRKDYSPQIIRQWENASDQTLKPSQFVNAAAWLVTRKCFGLVGGFGHLFFHYGEDYDFVHRMKFAGIKLGFVTGAKIHHDRETRTRDNFPDLFPVLKKYFYVGSLVRMADPNRTFAAAFLLTDLWNTKELGVLFFKGRWKAPAVLASVLAAIVKGTPDVIRYRREITAATKFRFLDL